MGLVALIYFKLTNDTSSRRELTRSYARLANTNGLTGPWAGVPTALWKANVPPDCKRLLWRLCVTA